METSVFKVIFTPKTVFVRGTGLPSYFLRTKQRATMAAIPKSMDRSSTSHQFWTYIAYTEVGRDLPGCGLLVDVESLVFKRLSDCEAAIAEQSRVDKGMNQARVGCLKFTIVSQGLLWVSQP